MSSNLRKDIKFAASQFSKEAEYWLDQLSGERQLSYFPEDRDIAEPGKRAFKTVKTGFTGELFAQMMKLRSGSDPRLYMILAAGLTVLLGKYTGNTDIIIGAPIYKQEREGKFINTVLALRNRLEEQMTFKDLLLQVRKTIIEADEHQNYPMEILLEKLGMEFSQNGFPLFNAAILLTNIHSKSYIKHIHLDTVFSFTRSRESLDVELQYNEALYRRSTCERLVKHLKTILRQALAHIDTKIIQLDMLSEDEKKQLLVDFNDTRAPYPTNQTVRQLFEEQVEQRPDAIAVIDVEQQLKITYCELNEKAGRLARLLRKKGVRPDDVVGIMADHSPEMIIGVLGILKADGAYLPIDPDTPENRVVFMLEDCSVSILLTQANILKRYSFTALQNLRLDRAECVLTSPRPQIKDFDGLPFPDRSAVDYEKYNRFIGTAMVKNNVSLQATRGCPYNCAYCHNIWPKTHMVRSAENIFSEVKRYYEIGVKNVTFIDDIFNLDIKNSMRFFQLIIEHKLDVHFHFPAGLRGDILTKEYIDLMVEAGLMSLALALETASPRLQKLIGKNLNIEKLRDNLHYICDTHPHVILELFTMHGFPTESEEEALLTLDFVKNLQWLHFPYLHILKIYPNTDMETLALENGIDMDAIARSANLAYHELPDTMPLDRSFILECQAVFFNDYFLSKERLLHVLPYQMKVLTPDEMVQKYDSYLPGEIRSFDELLRFLGIREEELGVDRCLDEQSAVVNDLNRKIQELFPAKKPAEDALKILMLDLSQFFSSESDMLYDIVEPPLGLMYVMTYLDHHLGSRIKGKIAKSRIDFDNYGQLKALLEGFKPDVIGIRSLTFHKDFFHKTVAMIRQWGPEVPIVAGGPYATSYYKRILQDRNIDLVVLGEGELTALELFTKIIENGGKLPGEPVLEEIKGIAFIPRESALRERFAREIIMLDTLDQVLDSEPVENSGHINKASNLAYTIFTSGSTGRPKGVMVDHSALTNFIYSIYDTFGRNFGPGDNGLSLTHVSFDVNVCELFLPLSFGGGLTLLPKDKMYDVEILSDALVKESVTFAYIPPGLLKAVYGHLVPFRNQVALDKLLVGVEPLADHVLENYLELNNNMRIINGYGPAETTICATFFKYKSHEADGSRVPIGQPLPNMKVFLLDKNNRLVPVGAAGEVCISGRGVARGYVNRPELTAEKFVLAPASSSSSSSSWGLRLAACGCRLYKTGDLARWLPEGNLLFLGRKDFQIKIRGYRIELEEIQSQLLKLREIKEAVVLVREPYHINAGETAAREKYLCAYIVSSRPIEELELKNYLMLKLPNFMIPARFVRLEKMPLSPNGKIDRMALAGMDAGGIGEKYSPPGNPVEEKLVEIWARLLNRKKETIGIDTNFFEIGGNSLKITTLVSRIQSEFNIKLSLLEAFKSSTIRKLARYIPVGEMNIAAVISADERLVLLKKAGNKEIAANLFFIHEITGQVEAYIELCNHLNTPFACYGIRIDSPRIGRYVPGICTIDSFAAQYIEIIKKVQPGGPYYMAGYSIGGTIAFEVARQLGQQKQDVKFLGLIDAPGPSKEIREKEIQYSLEDELQGIDQWLSGMEIEENLAVPLKEKLSQLSDLSQVWPLIGDYFAENNIPPDRIKKIVPAYVARLIPNFDQMGIRELIGYQTVIRSVSTAVSFYIPAGKVNTPVHFFIPAERENHEEIQNWTDFCGSPILDHEVNGNHVSMMYPPHVSRIAREMGNILAHS